MADVKLTNIDIDKFKKKGFVVKHKVFNHEELNQLSDYFEKLRLDVSDSGKEAKYYEFSDMNKSNFLARAENIIGEHNQLVKSVVMEKSVIEALTQLFNDMPVLFKDKINYKLPGCRADEMHQDQAAGWGKYANFFITIMLAIDNNTKENSALSFLKTGDYAKKLMGDLWQPLAELDTENLDKNHYKMVELDAGDIIIFDSYIPHGSSANYSQKQRRNFFITFNAASNGDHRDNYYKDKWKTYPPNKIEEARSSDTFLV